LQDKEEQQTVDEAQPKFAFDGPVPKGRFKCTACGAPKIHPVIKCANLLCSQQLKDNLRATYGQPTCTSADACESFGAEVLAQLVPLGKRQREQPRRFEPVEYRSDGSGKSKLRNYDHCFVCHKGGELLACDQCPQVYHLECLGMKAVPKGCFRCPWHACMGCERRASSVGGMIFHCRTCTEAYCFDCAPERYLDPELQRDGSTSRLVASLEHYGCPAKQYLWFSCDACVQTKKPLNVHHSIPKPRPKATPKLSITKPEANLDIPNQRADTAVDLIEAFEVRNSPDCAEWRAWRECLDLATLCAIERANGIHMPKLKSKGSHSGQYGSVSKCQKRASQPSETVRLVAKVRSRLVIKGFNIDPVSLTLATVTYSGLASRGLQDGLITTAELDRASTLLSRFEDVLTDPTHRRENGWPLTAAGINIAVLYRMPSTYTGVQVREVLSPSNRCSKNPAQMRHVMEALTSWFEDLANPLNHDWAIAITETAIKRGAAPATAMPINRAAESELELSLERVMSGGLAECVSISEELRTKCHTSKSAKVQLTLTPAGVAVCKAESLQRPLQGRARPELAAQLKCCVHALRRSVNSATNKALASAPNKAVFNNQSSLSGQALLCAQSAVALTTPDTMQGPWICDACTFRNPNPLFLCCQICGTHRGLVSSTNEQQKKNVTDPICQSVAAAEQKALPAISPHEFRAAATDGPDSSDLVEVPQTDLDHMKKRKANDNVGIKSITKRKPDHLAVGTKVWATLKGYPPWPAKVACPAIEGEAPREGLIMVAFYGENTFEWLPLPKLKLLNEHDAAERLCKSKATFKHKDLRDALQLALMDKVDS